MTTEERIELGLIPRCLEEKDWRKFRSTPLPSTWEGFAQAWWSVSWVRCQGFERDADAEANAEDW